MFGRRVQGLEGILNAGPFLIAASDAERGVVSLAYLVQRRGFLLAFGLLRLLCDQLEGAIHGQEVMGFVGGGFRHVQQRIEGVAAIPSAESAYGAVAHGGIGVPSVFHQ